MLKAKWAALALMLGLPECEHGGVRSEWGWEDWRGLSWGQRAHLCAGPGTGRGSVLESGEQRVAKRGRMVREDTSVRQKP
jgi:hypothetical protein